MMGEPGVDPGRLHAWLEARSLARGLPPPVADHGGFRVDTNSDVETARWVFAEAGPDLATLARSIEKPGYFIKLCGTAESLRGVLPAGWTILPPAFFMQARTQPAIEPLTEGYRIESGRTGMVTAIRIFTEADELAASGYAAETPHAFAYDRIATQPPHRRKGLGRALMAALHAAKTCSDTPELLVATEDGRALYSTLGWEIISPYATACFVAL